MIDRRKLKEPRLGDLRVFGVGLGVIGGYVCWWTQFHPVAIAIAVFGGVSTALAVGAPGRLAPFYRLWMNLLFPVAWLVSTIVLAAIYYVVVTPIGVIRRLSGKGTIPLSPA